MLPINSNVLDVQKCIEVLLYVTQHVRDMYKALKVVYFADRDHLERYGTLIYGDTYYALQHGPVPSLGYDILKDEDIAFPCPVAREARRNFRHDGHSRVPLRQPDPGYLSESDVECLDRSIRENGQLSFNELKTKSHDGAYKSADNNDVISIENIARDLRSAQALLEHLQD